MASRFIIVGLLVTLICTWEVSAHGRLVEPAARSTAWRLGYPTPQNYNDNELFCGGFSVQHSQNGGKCGPCGDNYADPQPRDNENGGTYGTGYIVQRYEAGKKINVSVDITANHLGHFEFSLCPLNSTNNHIESEECFDANPLYFENGDFEYEIGSDVGYYNLTLVLPKDLVCEHCVFRWHYWCGNNWGICNDGEGRVGCGVQEVFRGCADVTIFQTAN